MDWFSETFKLSVPSRTDDAFTFIKGDLRISVLTSRLIRIENKDGAEFCDEPTQSVLNRSFDKPSFVVTDNNANFAVKTDDAAFIFSSENKLIQVVFKDGKTVSDFHKGNLRGTRRTLDMTSGRVELEEGIISSRGVAIMDDSGSLILNEDGTIAPRSSSGKKDRAEDIYCFAYGHDYIGAIRDLYRLTGFTPLIPRFVLGNWWSRYKDYSQEEYLTLMERFEQEKIPITVATLDMDWHWVDVESQFGKEAGALDLPANPVRAVSGSYIVPGWTGYSWNTELFPDYKGFLKELKSKNYKVTLNLHPACGVKFFEDMYKEFAEFMGIDPETKKAIEFDITDKKFIEGYFKFLHHGYEADGVDFWWIDWQQGNKTGIPGLDPLWALNHYHSMDLAREGKKRPLILSRYAGVGSHRYPLGFSGDTAVNWKVLDFQPYFTANAANVGYSWWSHDIGGHHFGRRDDELYLRWLQFGVFSPIMRLHSTRNEFSGKEPWKYSGQTQKTAADFLRFRHRLIPYLYTMNMRTHKEGRALCEPIYYSYSEQKEAYEVPNEYFFGTELIAAPITKPSDSKTLMAGADTWLPPGRFTDIFTGRIYNGGRKLRLLRDLTAIPVLAKEGAIIPLSGGETGNKWQNPEDMEIFIYRGNGAFTLYEDDGETMDYEKGKFAETDFAVTENGGDLLFTVSPVRGDSSVIPESRLYTLSFKDVTAAQKVFVSVNGKRTAFSVEQVSSELHVTVELKSCDRLKVTLKDITERKNPPKKELLTELFSKIQGSNDIKAIIYRRCLKNDFSGKLIADKEIKDAVNEIIALSE